FVLAAAGGADLMVTNELDQQTGIDSSGDTQEHISQSVTFTDTIEDDLTDSSASESAQFVSISHPQDGIYHLSGTASTAEPYTLYTQARPPDGTLLTPVTMSGTVTPGTPITSQYDYESGSSVSFVSVANAAAPAASAGTIAYDFLVSLTSQP